MKFGNFAKLTSVAIIAILGNTQHTLSETIVGAMSKAYKNNSQLNSARAGVRVSDENVAIAKSGYRPNINATGTLKYTVSSSNIDSGNGNTLNGTLGVSINQTLFDGFQTKNNIKSAESTVFAARENLRNTQQDTLIAAVSAYMSVIRDRKIVVLRKRNLEFLNEQLRAARSRFNVGEGTRTEIAESRAQQAAAVATLETAIASSLNSEATYQQIVGEHPGKLSPAKPQNYYMPKSLSVAVKRAYSNHPAIRANEALLDSAGYQVKANEGKFLPSLTASAGVYRNYQRQKIRDQGTSNSRGNSADIGATLSIPIYQGGLASANVRQSKEKMSQARIEIDVARDKVRSNVTTSWNQFHASTESLSARHALVKAARLALKGIIEERNVGQRTTLDVLNSQAKLIDAQVGLVQAEYDSVVASYGILTSTGDLTIDRLKLPVVAYNPEEHYDAVKDMWYGLRTPDEQ